MRKYLKFSTHTFARKVQSTMGLTETCRLLARHLDREGDCVLIYQVSGWMREQYPQEAVVWEDMYFHLRGNVSKLRLAMAERLLAAPNRIVYIKRGE